MNKAEIIEMLKSQQAYDRYDRHMGEERIIDKVTEKFELRIVPLEKRITLLEHFRTAVKASVAAVTAIGASITAIVSWLKYGPSGKG